MSGGQGLAKDGVKIKVNMKVKSSSLEAWRQPTLVANSEQEEDSRGQLTVLTLQGHWTKVLQSIILKLILSTLAPL